MRLSHLPLLAIAVALVAPAACGAQAPTSPQSAAGGDARSGLIAIERHGCTSCHVIPGVRTAEDAWVGPPLTKFARRSYVAGVVTNTQENLQQWLLDPQSVDPLTAMPDVGLTEVEALDVVAYLHSLR